MFFLGNARPHDHRSREEEEGITGLGERVGLDKEIGVGLGIRNGPDHWSIRSGLGIKGGLKIKINKVGLGIKGNLVREEKEGNKGWSWKFKNGLEININKAGLGKGIEGSRLTIEK